MTNQLPFTNLTNLQWLAAHALLGLAADATQNPDKLGYRAQLAIQVAQQASAELAGHTDVPDWERSPAFPVSPGDHRWLTQPGLSVFEYAAGKLLVGALQADIWPTPSSVGKAVDTVIEYAAALVDELLLAGDESAFTWVNHRGLSQRDRLVVSVLSGMLANGYAVNGPHKAAQDAILTAQPLVQPGSGTLTKGQFFLEKAAPMLLNWSEGPILRFVNEWATVLELRLDSPAYPGADRANRGLTIREYGTAVIAGGILANLHYEDELPDNLVAMALGRFDCLVEFLADESITIDPEAPAMPVTGAPGIDRFAWLATHIVGVLGRMFGDVCNADIVETMVDSAVLQSQAFWLKVARHELEMAFRPANA